MSSLCRLSCAEEAVYSPSAYCCVGWVTGVKSGRCELDGAIVLIESRECELDGAIVLIESRECAEEAMYSPSSRTSWTESIRGTKVNDAATTYNDLQENR